MSIPPWDEPPPDARWGWDDANTTADAPAKPRLRAIHADEAMQDPPPAEIVEGMLWAGCVTILVAESSAGKTFVALDLAAAISAGLNWHGRDTTQGTVVHIGYEGDAIGLRLRAMREHRQARLQYVYRIRAAAPLSPLVHRDEERKSPGEKDVVDALLALASDISDDEAPPIALVIIDTIRASLSGSEDGSESVSAYLRAVRRILDAFPHAAALLVHHAGWQDGDAAKKRERGSSAFRGNVDATLYLEAGPYDHDKQSATLTLTTHKVRDGERPDPLHLIRQRVTFTDTDRRGKPLTSCVIDPETRTAGDLAAEKALSEAAAHLSDDQAVMRAILAHPDTATSQDRLKTLCGGIRKERVTAAVSRLLSAGWITFPTKQRQPYTVTTAGRQALSM